jgi:hypothetical protein
MRRSSPSGKKISALSLVLWMSSGCALKVGSSAVAQSDIRALKGGTLDVEAQVVDVLGRPGPYGSLHVGLADPDGPSHFGVRRATLGGGFRWVTHAIILEHGVETGAGEPTFGGFEGTGLYTGLVSSFFVRVCGDQDIEPGFAPVALLVDVGTTFRYGLWFPPAGTDVLLERSGQLAARLTIVSDLLDASGADIQR